MPDISHRSGLHTAAEQRLLQVVQSIRLDRLAVSACALLAESGVPHAVIKGVSTARWLYDPPREYRDVDLLVPAGRIGDAVRALAPLADASTGVFGEEAAHSQVLIDREHGAELDLHATLPACSVDSRDPERVWRVLGRHLETLEVDGRSIPVLDLPGRCVVLAMHVIASGFDSDQVCEDLRRARATVDADQWTEAARRAEALGLGAWFSAAAEFVAGRLDSSVPREVRLRLSGGSATAIQLARIGSMRPREALPTLARELWPTREFMYRHDEASRFSRAALVRARSRRLRGHVYQVLRLLREKP